ncbi:MAG: Flagellar hook protein FlgE [Synergistetes bacterium ADurb.Bin520]|nr:MAG: Flagellar hook protein FlgE [Synergistetes bacterium ADurb.Bin520]
MRVGFGEIGAQNVAVKLDFSGESFGKAKIEGITQYDSPFTTKEYIQNGYAMGILNDFSVTPDGLVNGSFTNGKNIPMYRLPLALFANPQGLDKTGDSCFREGANSGTAQLQFATEGGAGKIIGSTLEMSNVDLTDEFVTLIKGQRGFQASARVVSTGDQVLEELINLKR